MQTATMPPSKSSAKPKPSRAERRARRRARGQTDATTTQDPIEPETELEADAAPEAEAEGPGECAGDERLRRSGYALQEDVAADRYRSEFDVDVTDIDGSGAAGGIAGLLAALGGTLTPGFELVAEELDLYDHVEGADLVITGEGHLDA